jgi:hypothetical protein
MARTLRFAVAGSLALLSAACDGATTGSTDATSLASAFITTPAGFGATTSSYTSSDSANADTTGGYRGGGRHHGGPGGPGGHHDGDGCGANGLLMGFDFMGGGLGLDFMGGRGHGRPFDFTNLQGTCTTANGVTSCTSTQHGLDFVRTYAFTTAGGAAQTAFDSTTNTVVQTTRVTGTTTRRDSVTAVVDHSSQRTVSGLAAGSTQRTVSGTSAGTENLSGVDSAGVAFTAVRVIGDSISGIVIPVQNGRPTYPTAGTVIRSLRVTLTSAGATTQSARREVITYDGTATAKVVITHDGETKNCTLPLPHGRLTCQ